MRSLTLVIIFLFSLTDSFCQFNSPAINTIYPFDIASLNVFSYNIAHNDSIMPVYDKGKFHYINIYSKNKIGDMTFEEAYPFGEKYAIVKEAGKYGVLDKNGNYFLKPAYNKFDYNSEGLVFDNQNQYFSLQNGIFNFLYFYYPIGPQFSVYNKGEKLGLIFQNGKRTKAIYDSIITSGLSDIVLKKNKKIGIIDNKGTVIAPFQYTDYVGDRDLTPYQSEDYSGDRYFHENNMFAVKYKSTWHYYLEGKKLFESNITPYILHYNVIVFQTNDLYNYMDNTGKVVLPENYKWISPSGYVAINKNDEVVLFNNKKEEFIYFKK